MQNSRAAGVAFEKDIDKMVHNGRRGQVRVPSSDEQLLRWSRTGFDGVGVAVDRTRSGGAGGTSGGERDAWQDNDPRAQFWGGTE